MFKRDIIVNYGSLDELVRQLDTYVNALNDIRSAVKSIMLKMESGRGLTIEHLKERDSTLVFEIDQVQKEILDLKNIIKNYTDEMTNIIKPVVRSNFMQVDRNDIWMNKEAINTACRNVYNIPNNTIIWAYNEGYSMFDDEDELADKRRNARNLYSVQRTLSGSKAKFDRLIEKMDSLYKIVKNYENKDDYFCERAKQLKADNTSFFEGVEDVLDGIAKTKQDFYKGVFEGLKDCVLGLKDLLAGVVKYAGAAIVCDTAGGVKYIGVAEELQEKREDNIPKWAKTCYTETNDKILAVLHDPVVIGESLAQGASDALDHKGMAYGTGEVGAMVLVSVAGDKGISKAKSLALGAKAGKTLDKLDDVAGGVSKVKLGDKLDDVARAAESKLDDVAFGGDEAVKIGGVEKSSNVADGTGKASTKISSEMKNKILEKKGFKWINTYYESEDYIILNCSKKETNESYDVLIDFDLSELKEKDCYEMLKNKYDITKDGWEDMLEGLSSDYGYEFVDLFLQKVCDNVFTQVAEKKKEKKALPSWMN